MPIMIQWDKANKVPTFVKLVIFFSLVQFSISSSSIGDANDNVVFSGIFVFIFNYHSYTNNLQYNQKAKFHNFFVITFSTRFCLFLLLKMIHLKQTKIRFVNFVVLLFPLHFIIIDHTICAMFVTDALFLQ